MINWTILRTPGINLPSRSGIQTRQNLFEPLSTGLTSEKETVLPDIPSKAFWQLSLPLDDRDVCPVLKEFQVIPARLF